jgi:hypothetical protein
VSALAADYSCLFLLVVANQLQRDMGEAEFPEELQRLGV